MEHRPRVLVVEDDPGIGPQVVAGLIRAGLDATLAADGRTAAALMEDGTNWGVVVLDLMLPDIDGFTLLEQWRHRSSAPVVVLTADTELSARLRSFELGAVDWIPKPFFMEELVARIRTRLGLGLSKPPKRIVSLGAAELDLDRRQAFLDGQSLGLTAHEVNLLALLVAHPGRAYTREGLAERALPAEASRASRTIDSHIAHLRKKLGEDAVCLETVYGVGYVWSDP